MEYINKLYKKNPNTGDYVIEVDLNSYVEIFNEWDHSSYKRRDISPDLTKFLEECSNDIPERFNLEISFYLPNEIRDENKEKIITEGIKTCYDFYAHFEQRKLNSNYKRMINSVFISFILLLFYFIFTTRIRSIIWEAFAQGFLVGGWVFMWEAISFFFFGRVEIKSVIRNYERLRDARISFTYSK